MTSPSATSIPTSDSTGSSPLLFFVALGFGVIFANLWIIVGVKYCFRYNRRSRNTQEHVDMEVTYPRRRRREKKLMNIDQVNENFPIIKFKLWRSTRESQGLPSEGGVDAQTVAKPPSVHSATFDASTLMEEGNAIFEGVSAGDACAICIDTMEDDDDVRGLTCGHAFHAVCIDPWFTTRRACCPLCKADYYIPKGGEASPQPQSPETEEYISNQQLQALFYRLSYPPPEVADRSEWGRPQEQPEETHESLWSRIKSRFT